MIIFFTGSVCGVKQPEALDLACCEVLMRTRGPISYHSTTGDKLYWGCGDMTSNGRKEHHVVGLGLTQATQLHTDIVFVFL